MNPPIKPIQGYSNSTGGGFTLPVQSQAVTPTPVVTNPTITPSLKTFNQQMVNSPATNGTGTNTSTAITNAGGTTGNNAGAGVNTNATGNNKNYGGLFGDNIVASQLKQADSYSESQANTPVDPMAIRQQKLDEMQAQIDATNSMYANKLNQAKLSGSNRLGQTGAINARRGLLGSDFGAAETDNTNTANNEIYGGIEAERSAAVNALITKSRDNATAEIATKNAAREAGLTQHIAYLKDSETRKEKAANTAAASFVSAGIDPNEIDQMKGTGTLDKLAADHGITTDAFLSAYSITKKASDIAKAAATNEAALKQSEVAKNNVFNVTRNGALYQRDPVTGKLSPVGNANGAFGARGGTGTAGGTSGGSTTSSGNPVLPTYSGGNIVAGVKIPSNVDGNDVTAVLEGRDSLANIRATEGRSKAAAAKMQALRDAIYSVDPRFDFNLSNSGTKLVSSTYYQKANAAVQTVLPNVEKVVDLSNQVGRLGVAGVDSLLQKGAIQLGNQKVSNFHQAQKLIADEIGVALGAGTVSDMKLQLGFDITDPSLSPEVFASNMGIVKEFLDNRSKGLNAGRYSSSVAGLNGVNQGNANTTSPTANATDPNKYDYNADLQEAKTAIQSGADPAKVQERFNQKYSGNTKF